jgi:hypothetical protein
MKRTSSGSATAKQTQFVFGRRCAMKARDRGAKRLRHAGAPDERFAKQSHFTLRGPETPDWPSPARRLALKAQVAMAYRDVAHGASVRLQRTLLQNKPNFFPCAHALAVRSGTSTRPLNQLFWLSRNGCRIDLSLDCRTHPRRSNTPTSFALMPALHDFCQKLRGQKKSARTDRNAIGA